MLDQRIKLAFELALSRKPNKDEFKTLKNYASDFINNLATTDQDKDNIIKSFVNEALANSSASVDQCATLVAISRAILNTDNFITRE